MNRKYITLGILMFLLAGYLIGLATLYRELLVEFLGAEIAGYWNVFSAFLGLAGLLVFMYGVFAPTVRTILRTGEEVANVDCSFKGRKAVCRIRLEYPINDRLFSYVLKYLTEERKYVLKKETEEGYMFYRGIKGVSRLWSKRVWVHLSFIEGDNESYIELDYRVGLLINPFLTGNSLYLFIEAEVLGLYRYIRWNFNNIYREKYVPPTRGIIT